jgi:hypothetical protein
MGLLALSEKKEAVKRFQDAGVETLVGITVIAYQPTLISFHERSDCHSRVKHPDVGSVVGTKRRSMHGLLHSVPKDGDSVGR